MAEPATSRRGAALEVGLLYAAGLAVLGLSIGLARLGGVFAENQGTLTAAFFLLAPVVLLRRRGIDPADLGIHASGVPRALLAAILAALVVFPPYVAGFEAWSRWVSDAPLDVPVDPLRYFDATVRDRPDLGAPGEGLRVWVEADRLYVVNGPGTTVHVRVDGCTCDARAHAVRDGALWDTGRPAPCHDGIASLALAPRAGFSCPVGRAERLAVSREPAGPILGGAASTLLGDGRVELERSAGWLPGLLLIHLVVVALPEEVFYRGYVQGRLRPLFRRRWRLLGADVGLEVVAASGLFALSHLVLVPAPFRLAVFFPGLLFGWLRARTGSILAPAVLHALSNVLLELLVRWHGG